MSLLEEMEATDGGGSGSLLDELRLIPDEEESETWLPEEVGEGIEGKVLKRYSVTSDHKDTETGTYPVCPVVVVDVGGGDLWKITGYRKILREEMEKCDPQPGDDFAAIYRGGPLDEKGQIKYHVYHAAVRKPAVTSRRAASNGAGNGVAAPSGGAATAAPAKKARRKPGDPKPKTGATELTKGGAGNDEPPF